LLSTGIILTSASLLLFTQTKGFLLLLLFVFVIRFSSSFFHPVGIGWISRTFKKDRLDWSMGFQSALGNLGAFIAILSTPFLAEITDWEVLFYIWAAVGVVVLLLGLFLTRNINKEYIIVEKKVNKKQTIKEAVSEAFGIFKRIKLLIPAFIVSGAAWGITINFLPLLLYEKTSLSLPVIGIIVSIWIGIGVITCLLYEKIQLLLGRRNTLLVSYLTIGLAGFALCIFTNIAIILLLMIFLGLSTFITFPALFSYVSEIIDKTAEGKSFGYILTAELAGATILLFLSGWFSDIWGIWMPFAILGAFSLLVGFLLIGNRKKDIV
jgi:MFS family permease